MRLLLFVTLLCVPLLGNAQSKELDSPTFHKALIDAENASNQTPHRRTIIEVRFENGKVVNTTTSLLERIPPDKSRSVDSYYLGKGLEKSTVIQIGQVYYCRSGEKPWKKSNEFCGRFTVIGEPPDSAVKYAVENVELDGGQGKLYTAAGTYHGAENILRSFEEKTWINEKGFIVRRERTTASEEGGVKYGSKSTITIEYDPKDLKIAPPI